MGWGARASHRPPIFGGGRWALRMRSHVTGRLRWVISCTSLIRDSTRTGGRARSSRLTTQGRATPPPRAGRLLGPSQRIPRTLQWMPCCRVPFWGASSGIEGAPWGTPSRARQLICSSPSGAKWRHCGGPVTANLWPLPLGFTPNPMASRCRPEVWGFAHSLKPPAAPHSPTESCLF